MGYTALTDAALAGSDVLVMEWVLECRNGKQARNAGAWTTIELTEVPTIRRGGSGLYATAEFSVDRDWNGGVLDYADDYDDTNPLQMGSEVQIKCRVRVQENPELWEEEYKFRGYVDKVNIDAQKLSVFAYDKLGVCKRAICKLGTGTPSQRQGYIESEISATLSGTITLEVVATNTLAIRQATYPQAWYGGSPRSWKRSAIHLYKQGASDPEPRDSWRPYHQEGVIRLTDTPSGTYELRQEGGDWTVKVYKMPGEAGSLTVGEIIESALTYPKWADAGGGLVEAHLGPGFDAADLVGLSPGAGAVSYFEWDVDSGTVEELLSELLSERWSGAYKLYYDPVTDKVIGLDETDFKTKADNAKATPAVYDIDSLCWVSAVRHSRTLDDVQGGVVVRGRKPAPEAVLKPSDSAKITTLLPEPAWTRLDLVPYMGWNAEANLLNGLYEGRDYSVGYGLRKDGEIGNAYDFIEIDLGRDEPLAGVMVAFWAEENPPRRMQIWIYAKASGGTYELICPEVDGDWLSNTDSKGKYYELAIVGLFRYIKVRGRAFRGFGAGRQSEGVIALTEMQVHRQDRYKEVIAVQETDAAEADTYYPALVDKYFACGLPVKIDDREFIRTEDELKQRGRRLVYWGVRAPIGFVVESGQVDPRELLYKTAPVSDPYNISGTAPVLIEAVEISPAGTRLECTDYYTEGWV